MWQWGPTHRETIIQELKAGNQLQFINVLLVDTKFNLEELLVSQERFFEIRRVEEATPGWNEMAVRRRRQFTNESNEYRICHDKYFDTLNLAYEFAKLVYDLTSAVPEPFLQPYLVNGLVATINKSLGTLRRFVVKDCVSPSSSPIRLWYTLILIYLNLESDVFAQALADDERSFSLKLFEDVASTIEPISDFTPQQVR